MIDPFGIGIHEPDVVFTDLGLAVLAAYLGRRLWTTSGPGSLPRSGAVLMAALASAALWGAVFHAFFPAETATLPGFIAWIPVVLSIIVAASTMVALGLRILARRLTSGIRRTIVVAYAMVFAAVALLLDESFGSIVRFYVPALLFLLIAASERAARTRSAGWTLIAAGLVVSAGAALLQQAEVTIHPVYFDHNALYHLVQGIALVALYLGFRRAPDAPAHGHGLGTNPAPRPG